MDKLHRLLSSKEIMIGGHRGMSASYPENTLPAIEAAIDAGVDLVEFDVYLTHDNVPVLCHDMKLERCSNGEGFVFEKNLAELKKLDFGLFKGKEWEGLRLPTLEELFTFMKNYPDVLMDVDIKPADKDLDCATVACNMAEKTGAIDRCIFNSIDCAVVHQIYERYGRRTVGAPDWYPSLRNFRPGKNGTFSELWGICVPAKGLSLSEALRLEKEGITIVTTPADTEDEVNSAIANHARLLLSNNPSVPVEMRHRGML